MMPRRPLLAILTVLACLANVPVGLQPARAEGNRLAIVDDWQLPADLGMLPTIAVDGPAHVGYLLSGRQDSWDHVQAVDSGSGRPLSPRVVIPAMRTFSPMLVDSRRHLVIYVEAPAADDHTAGVTAVSHIVGIGLRGGAVQVQFRVASRLPGERLAGMTLDDAARDIVLLSARNPSDIVQSLGGTSLVHVDRLSLDGLMHNALSPRWTQPYQLPVDLCPELLSGFDPAALLMAEARLYFACRPPVVPTTTFSQTFKLAQQAGIVGLSGLSTADAPTISATFFQAPGEFAGAGTESFAEEGSRRIVLSNMGAGSAAMRVFDTDHGRYVGTIQGRFGARAMGMTSDRTSGRLYYANGPNNGALGVADLAPVVPAQGEIEGFSQLFAGGDSHQRLAFDEVSKRLFVPHREVGGRVFLAVLRDDLPAYVAPPLLDYDAGALDTSERPGFSDSSRSATASAYGASYALVGGLGNLLTNITGTDDAAATFKGSRSLRQAFVKAATLTGDASTAQAVLGEEDTGTDQNRTSVSEASERCSDGGDCHRQVDAGDHFAPPAICADFGASPSSKPSVVLTAQVSCDVGRARSLASVTFNTLDGLLMTTGARGSFPAPVQVGRSRAEVVEQRAPGRGALVTTVQATAENISLLGVATIASVSSRVSVSAHGRHGTALAGPPTITVSGVVVQGVPVCTSSCSLNQVAAALNSALGIHGRVEFPNASVTRSPGGTLASVGQDPWYHAERVLDADQAAEDYAVPAMTVTIYLEGSLKSRLVVDLAAVSAGAIYRVFPLIQDTTGPAAPPSVQVPALGPPAEPSLPASPATQPPQAVPQPDVNTGAAGGALGALVQAVRLALRSPSAALPLILVWALLGVAPYLAARRRLLLELPMLTREQELA